MARRSWTYYGLLVLVGSYQTQSRDLKNPKYCPDEFESCPFMFSTVAIGCILLNTSLNDPYNTHD